MGASKLGEKTDVDVKIQKQFDAFEAQSRKHLRTKKISFADGTYITWNESDAQFDFYINKVLVGHVNAATGFVND